MTAMHDDRLVGVVLTDLMVVTNNPMLVHAGLSIEHFTADMMSTDGVGLVRDMEWAGRHRRRSQYGNGEQRGRNRLQHGHLLFDHEVDRSKWPGFVDHGMSVTGRG